MRDLAVLFRLPVSLMAALSALFGALLARSRLDGRCFGAALAVMFLAWACSAWNQVQERRTDALMTRTADRPLPSGRLSAPMGTLLGTLSFLAACGIFHAIGGWPLVGVSAGIALVYNGIYTPLKKRSCFALLAGISVGAAPPLTGWLAAGGWPGEPLPALIYGLYALWQIPHFWLRVDLRREDYQRAGFPLPPLVFAVGQDGRLLEIWFYAFASALLMLPVFPLFQNSTLRLAASVVGLLTFAGAGVLRPRNSRKKERTASTALALADSALLLAMLLLAADKLLAAAL